MNIISKIKRLFKIQPKLLTLENTIRECTQTRMLYFEIGLNTLLACEHKQIKHTDATNKGSITYNRKDLIKYIFDNCTKIPHHYQSRPGKQVFLMYLYDDLKDILVIKDIRR